MSLSSLAEAPLLERWKAVFAAALDETSDICKSMKMADAITPKYGAGGLTDAPSALLGVPDCRQPDDYSCLACCAKAVADYYNVSPQSLEAWKEQLGTSREESTRPRSIAEYLASLGLQVEARQDMMLDDLRDYWRRGWPVIIFLKEYGVPSKHASFNYGHGVVSVGVALGFVFVMDPSIDNVLSGEDADQAPGLMPIAEKKFLEVWHDTDADKNVLNHFGIAVGPPVKGG